MRGGLILVATIAVAPVLIGATRPAALAQVSGGLWEIDGVPGAKSPLRQCIADVVNLARFEHRGRNCAQSVIADHPGSVLIEYKCGAAGFGRSQIDVITPRSLRINTQGISDNLPFNYVLQARRVGDCPKNASSTRH
jgi:hypothetical protein